VNLTLYYASLCAGLNLIEEAILNVRLVARLTVENIQPITCEKTAGTQETNGAALREMRHDLNSLRCVRGGRRHRLEEAEEDRWPVPQSRTRSCSAGGSFWLLGMRVFLFVGLYSLK
jgi:hypothetical protein